jgi:hypothetical protein
MEPGSARCESTETIVFFFQLGVHRNGRAKHTRNQAARFGANGCIDKPALGRFRQPGNDVQQNVHYGPTGSAVFQGYRCRRDDVAFRQRALSQFIRQRQGKASRVSGGYQLGRVCIGIVPAPNGRGQGREIQHATFSGDGLATPFCPGIPAD